MGDLADVLRSASARLNTGDWGWALVGGLAVSVRTEPRFTRDIDLAVSVESDAEAEAIVHAFRQDGFTASESVEHEATGRLATARLSASDESQIGPVLDLLFASSGIEAEIVASADLLEALPGLTLPVATAGHLIALKLLARSPDRPQDEVDLHSLIRGSTQDDLGAARRAVELITARGYARGRHLTRDLDAAVGPGPS